MQRNYNGNPNRKVLRDLRKLCKVNVKDFQNLMKRLAENGQVSFYTNPDPFTGLPDEFSKVCTLKSKEEVTEYLKEYFCEKLQRYLNYEKPADDYLLNKIIEFLKQNGGIFPAKSAMRQLEIEAENERISKEPSIVNTENDTNTAQFAMREILELCADIMEKRNEEKPKDIFVPVEPYDATLKLGNDSFSALIQHDIWYGCGDISDYSLVIRFMEQEDDIDTVTFVIYSENGEVNYSAKNWEDIEVELTTNCLIEIHKGIVEFAKKEGLEFISEVDYEKVK